MIRSIVTGAGMYLPPRKITNHDLMRWMDTTNEWVVERTGIEERYFVESGVGSTDLGLEAAKKALVMAKLEPKDLDFIIFATLSPDIQMPGVAPMFSEKLGCGTIGTLDIRNQCTGFVYSMSVADAFIRTGMYKRILVVGAETHSTGLDLSTRGRDVSVIFGDGAGAVVMEAHDKDDGRGVLTWKLHADGKHYDKLWCELPASWFSPRLRAEWLDDPRFYAQMQGPMVFKHAVRRLPEVIDETLEAAGYTMNDIDLLVPHQANMRINQFVAAKYEFPNEKVVHNIQKYGNTTAATIPICITEALADGRIQPGKLVLIASFGAGFTWAAMIVRW